jgi:hypothetical protein
MDLQNRPAPFGIWSSVWRDTFFGYLLNTIFVKTFITVQISPGVAKLLAAAIQAPISYLALLSV